MGWNTLNDVDLAGKVVLTRVDINVPVEDGIVTDSTRIKRIKPTIMDILAAGGKPVLLAHFGRPNGKYIPEMSLRVTVPILETILGRTVTFIEHPSRAVIDATPADAIILIENTRFSLMEEQNDSKMATFLASLGDVFCNDAFSASHRAHASTTGVAALLPNCAGRLMAEELSALGKALGNPQRPVVAVVGGAKVSTKLDLLGNLIDKVNTIIIGGGMANTFLAAQGHDVGKSLCEYNLASKAKEIIERARLANCKLVLPCDVVVAPEFKANAAHETVAASACPPDMMILDAGPNSIAQIRALFVTAKTVIWNGPLGAFEIEPFQKATFAAAKAAADMTKLGDLITVAGGGDTVAALNTAGVADDFTYISTAGGAFLEWMEGKTLPGVAALGG